MSANSQSQVIVKSRAEDAPPSVPANNSEESESLGDTGTQESNGELEENKAAATLFGLTPSMGIFFGIALLISLGGATGVFFFRNRILP